MADINELLNALITQKNTLASNINAMGVTASAAEKLNTLVPKVLDIHTGIELQQAAVPTVSSEVSFTYSGTSQGLTFSGYDSDTMTLSGVSSATNAGNYSVAFVPKFGYKWTDGTYDLKAFNWTISKANPSLSLSMYAATVFKGGTPATITASYNGDGVISAVSSDTAIATAVVSGNNIIIEAAANGTATVTVTLSASSNYEGAMASVSVTAKICKAFADCTDTEMEEMLQAHYNGEINIGDYWHVGDTRDINIAAISATTDVIDSYAAQTMPIRIIGIEHDVLSTYINGHIFAAVTVECVYSLGLAGKYIWGKYVNFTDNQTWTNNPRRMWLWRTFKDALPSYIKNSIKSVLKLTKSPHTGHNGEYSNELVFLLSVYEVYKDTDTNYSNTTNKKLEGDQYKFYETAENRAATDYYNDDRSKRAYRWLRSPALKYDSSYGYCWCAVYNNSTANTSAGGAACGICPAWCM